MSSSESEGEIDQNTAYRAALDLKRSIQSFQKATKYNTHISRSRLEFISNELSFLKPFFKIMRLLPSNASLDLPLESRVIDEIDKLKDVIRSYIYGDVSLTMELSQQLIQVRQEIGSFSETLKADEEYKRREEQSCSNFTSATTAFIGKKNMVGLNDDLSRLKDFVLKDADEERRIIITGMTGIGKTALVQEIYKDQLVAEHFEAYLFLQFGPRYKVKEILLLALHQLGFKFHENDSLEQLQDYVKESLSGVRYLVVLDDVWNDDTAFEELYNNILPDDKMLNCIIVTTQNENLRLPTSCTCLPIRFLDDNESWDLLRETVFTCKEEWCDDRQLERVGRKIAKNCEGLPLAIIQVGELLRHTDKTVQEWKIIAEKDDPISITRDDGTPLSNALSLSYNMLPPYLKVCFLYIGVFPKKYEILRWKLIQLWISEDFIGDRLEETAGRFLDELVSHSCVLSVEFRSIHGRETKSCKLHFTFRSLCVSEAKRDKFFHVIRKYEDCFPENMDSQQRLCIHNNVVLGFKQVHEWMESVPDVLSFLCFGKQQYPIVLYLPFRLLQVLDVLAIRFYEFPDQVLDLFELTYFAITCDEELPPSISRLQNLEVFIFRSYHNIIISSISYLPIEIWKLSKLKHLHCMGFDLPDPSSLDDSLILGRLLTLLGVSSHSCTRGVLARMPILKKIGTKINSVEKGVGLLGDFSSLSDEFHSLKCDVMYPNLVKSQVVIPSFPKYVTKMTLSGCGFPWEYTRVIGALSNLKVLKLQCHAFCGPEWKMSDVEKKQFLRLQYLVLEDLDIQHWVINDDHNVRLRCLVIKHCYKLHKIPKRLLRSDEIELECCSLSLVKQIQDRPPSYKYTDVRISSAWDDDKN